MQLSENEKGVHEAPGREYAFGKVAFRKSIYILEYILKTCNYMKIKRAFTRPAEENMHLEYGKVAFIILMYLYTTTVLTLSEY